MYINITLIFSKICVWNVFNFVLDKMTSHSSSRELGKMLILYLSTL